MTLLLLMALGCESPNCTLTIDDAHQTCEVDEDCAVVTTDCEQGCTCAAVNVEHLGTYQGKTAPDCDEACAPAPCNRDCSQTLDVLCRRNVCETVSGGSDTFGG